MMALYHRDAGGGGEASPEPGRRGQVVDVSLFEPLFRLCIPHVTMYDLLGINRERVGNDFPDAAPRSLYRTGDQRWLGLSATSQSTFEGLAKAMGMPDLIDRPAFVDNASRIENRDELNDELNGWLGERTLQDTLDQLIPAGGVVGPVYGAADIVEDPALPGPRGHHRNRRPGAGPHPDAWRCAQVQRDARAPWSTPAPPWGSTTPRSTVRGWGLDDLVLSGLRERGVI